MSGDIGTRARPGATLPTLRLEVSYLRCVQCVAATRDFNPLHYDREYARSAGMPDVFLNTMTYQGLFGRLVTTWSGRDSFVRRLAFEMLKPTIPGDTIEISGHVTGALTVAGETAATAELVMHTERAGIMAKGEALVSWAGGRS